MCVFLLQLEGKLTLHQHLSDLVDLALTMMKVMDEINSDSFQSFKLRIGEECVHTLCVMASTCTLQLDPQWKLVRIYVCMISHLFIIHSFSQKVFIMDLWFPG